METVDARAGLAEAPPLPAVVPALAPPASWSPDEKRANRAWAITLTAALLVIFLVLHFLPAVGWPLIVAAVGAYLFDPVVSYIASKGLNRTWATAALLGTGLLVGAGILLLVVPMLVHQVEKLPAYVSKAFTTLVPRLQQAIGRPLPRDVGDVAQLLGKNAEELVSGAGSIAGKVLGTSLSVLSAVLGTLVIPVVGFYLLRGWPKLIEHAKALVPERQRPAFYQRMGEVDHTLGGFIRGQLTMAAVLTGLYSGALSLIGLKLGIVVGLVTGIGNLVPYLGTTAGITLATVFCLVDFGPGYHLLLVLGTFLVLVATDSLFITPRIVGNRVGLSPAAVILAVLTCGSLFGFAGVLLAVPTAALLKHVAQVSVELYRQSRLYREG